ncbi:endo-1,4-beta-xylanase [Microbacterium sediminis]|uniref:Beta-xylanase n=1 Tax=Microbacterium sediminis TaxID=904291 RepID=A0A1B9NAI3_9MICO|nr:endo-1,4-beta-xylanase [Microbacterium sediminis]OCG73606.1 1,4-beta-xylanase [Microbacterium sediminis]QBR73284.1 1,4-beta-xylanase [Microbacterium sediminis]
MTLAHRHGSVVVTVIGDDGSPLAHHDVRVEQIRHAFGFGNIGFDLIPHANGEADERALADAWLALFDTATLPFYWGDFEPERGRPDTARLLTAARWFAERGVRLKGHPLVWHTVKARWLDPLPSDEVERVIRDRITREVRDFAGVIDTWDAINEVAIMPVFENEPDGVPNAVSRLARERGRTAMVRLAFETARAARPSATLLINDFDLSERYERVIEDALAAGIAIDAIGLQTHMHQGFRGVEWLREKADRFARFGLPLHFTEVSLVSGALMPPEIDDLNDYVVDSWPSTPEGEQRQADELEALYRALTEHPAVQAITYWGLSDRGAWLGAPIGLLRADGSPKPSYERLRSLIRGEWWTPATTLRTDAAGRIRVAGWRGRYRVSAGAAIAEFDVDEPEGGRTIALAAPH